MPRASPPRLAKLTPPRTTRAILRPRLFAAIDRALEAPALWVAGGPGAGKTTLVATYLAVRKRPMLWYQIDAGDAEPANLFHYLAIGAAPRNRIPGFGPEAQRNLPAFARNFFRALYASLPVGCALVFDNAHEAASPALHELLLIAIAEAPHTISVVVLSRNDVPPDLVGALAASKLGGLSPDILRFNEAEAAELIARIGRDDPADASALLQQVGGWPAGLVLLAQRPPDSAAGPDNAAWPLEQVFAYFAVEIFAGLEEPAQRVLLDVAMLNHIRPDIAAALSGATDAGAILESCHRRNLFIERRDTRVRAGGQQVTYQLHPLFSAFLREQAVMRRSACEHAALLRRAISLLDAQGSADEAIDLCLAGQETDSARQLIAREAPRLLREGRHTHLCALIARADPARENAWLCFWLGLAQTHLDQAVARASLNAAFQAFARIGDAHGQLVSAGAMLDAIHSNWSTFDGLEEWLATTESLYRQLTMPLEPAAEIRVLTGLVSGVLLLRSDDSRLTGYAERLLGMLEGEIDVNDRIAAANALLTVADAMRRLDWLEQISRHVAPLLKAGVAQPRRLFEWHYLDAMLALADRRLAQAQADADACRALIETNVLEDLAPKCALIECDLLIDHGEIDAAARLLDRTEKWLDTRQPMTAAAFFNRRAQVAVLQRDGEAALRYARRAEATAAHARCLAPLMTFYTQCEPPALMLLRRYAEAIEASDRFASEGSTFANSVAYNRMMTALIRAHLAVADGHADRRERLAHALGIARELNRLIFFRTLPREAGELCAAAIEDQVEVDFVRVVIRSRGLTPPAPAPSNWPWPVRIRAFGAFAIERDDAVVAAPGKAQKKPLELIKALVAAGGDQVGGGELSTLLWREADGDAAAVALRVNLHRARKLLGRDDAILLDDGRLSFNRSIVWLDTVAFDECARLLAQDAGTDISIGNGARNLGRLLELYRGAFLAGDGDAPWALPARERYRGTLLRAVERAGTVYAAKGRWDDAIAAYEQGIAAEPLAEELYRGMMGCLLNVGRHNEALRAYRRCKEMLSVVLGLKPSAATESLVREIYRSQT
jgi:LuxR family transcriptional regulator, maltose regulon positive regulatory protein